MSGMKMIAIGLLAVALTAGCTTYSPSQQPTEPSGQTLPALSAEYEWRAMTPEKLSELLETHNGNARLEDGRTALMLAAQYNENPEVTQLLLEAGADVNARNEYGSTALTLAAEFNSSPEVIRLLVDAGADVNVRDEFRSTAVMLAAGYNEKRPEVVHVLINARVDV